jgi:hypothetical protein
MELHADLYPTGIMSVFVHLDFMAKIVTLLLMPVTEILAPMMRNVK